MLKVLNLKSTLILGNFLIFNILAKTLTDFTYVVLQFVLLLLIAATALALAQTQQWKYNLIQH